MKKYMPDDLRVLADKVGVPYDRVITLALIGIYEEMRHVNDSLDKIAHPQFVINASGALEPEPTAPIVVGLP